jgi:hypothetical protein
MEDHFGDEKSYHGIWYSGVLPVTTFWTFLGEFSPFCGAKF